MKLSAPKGTKDILPSESYVWQFMEDKAKFIFDKSNYKEIRTPIFEATELFARGVGNSTDIVNKEMYTFIQKERSLTLRPENTAGVVRAFIEHGMFKLPSPLKMWYKGPMFRYERPQAGRQRQFHQIGVEVFGIKSAIADAEVIQMAMWYLNELKISKLSLEINNLGCEKCREEHKNKIKEAVKPILAEFCEDCNIRYERNSLRMLDCKNEKCKQLLASTEIDAIINDDYICPECSDHFIELQGYLKALNIEYTINKRLVRGLDYYNKTVFEITSNALGSQNAVCGGGRYDPLVEMLGGPSTPAVGWAMGMERLLSLMELPKEENLQVFIVSNYMNETIKIASELRISGICTDYDLGNRGFSKQLDKAAKSGAKYALIIGEEELKTGNLTLKNLLSGIQKKFDKNELILKFCNKKN
ncbi:MAG: histidine--tRNA ligase [Candidatus Gastranaerophilales bacterium]|nr:histidine--tRNA ligase [Candidatus Gastranaerophilales bacterium]